LSEISQVGELIPIPPLRERGIKEDLLSHSALFTSNLVLMTIFGQPQVNDNYCIDSGFDWNGLRTGDRPVAPTSSTSVGMDSGPRLTPFESSTKYFRRLSDLEESWRSLSTAVERDMVPQLKCTP
jgi:hypothetical protein